MRLAFFSPVNPQKSGISDYSEELLPWLAREADIDLFLEERITPSTPAIADNFSWYPFTQFEQQYAQAPYDMCLYQMGNNTACHRYMDAFIQRYPGIITLHDYMIHHLYAEVFTEEKRYDEYEAAMVSYYGELGKQLADTFRQGIRCDYVYYQFPFYQRVVNPGRGTIVHASYVKTKLLEYNPNYQVEMIPMGVIPPDLSHYNIPNLRDKHHIPRSSFILASFGFIIEGKRIRELLQAFSAFVDDVPDALCLLVGKEAPDFNVRALIHELQLNDNIIITGYTPYAEFLEYIVLTDVCVNLRYPTVRSTSANILKIMGFAKPVLMSDLCEYLDIPENCCVKIPLNETEECALLKVFHLLYNDPEQRNALGQKARNFVEKYHSMQQAADKYMAFCEKIINQ